MGLWVIGALLGAVAGAAGGFVAGLFELMLRRAANRARRRSGGPVARNEVLSPFWLPGAVVGAMIGAATIGLGGWGRTALVGFFVPIAVWLAVRLFGLVFDRIRN